MKIKYIIITIGIILIIASVGYNIYTGLNNLYQKGVQYGLDSAVLQIKNGTVVNLDTGTIEFIPNQ